MNARTFADATMDDPVSLALLWGSAGFIMLALIAAIAAVLLRGKPEQPDDEPRNDWHTTELCMIHEPQQCGNEWQHDVNGWRLCHKHYASTGVTA